MSELRKPSTGLQWHPHSAHIESAVIDIANARQIALRTRLRHHFWLTECKPLGPTTLALTLKKMTMIDSRDEMSTEEVEELLSDHYGFESTEIGFVVPELIEARDSALKAAGIRKERASTGGKAKAAATAVRPTEVTNPITGEITQASPAGPPNDNPEDF
jgi:hypothetical protein